MKSKDLIEALKAADPSGEIEVCVNNGTIIRIDKQPAYYDGCLEKTVIDEDGKISIEMVRHGEKIAIYYNSIEDILFDNPDTEISYQAEKDKIWWETYINKERARIKALHASIRLKGIDWWQKAAMKD